MKNIKSLLTKLLTGLFLFVIVAGFLIGGADEIYFYVTDKSFTMGPTMKVIDWLCKLVTG